MILFRGGGGDEGLRLPVLFRGSVVSCACYPGYWFGEGGVEFVKEQYLGLLLESVFDAV